MNNRYCATIDSKNVQQAVGVKGKYWPVGRVIKIGFINGTKEQHEKVKEYAAEWLYHVFLEFDYVINDATADIRISFNSGNGSWSYLGTDALNIPKTYATMNFGWLDKAVVLHEFGHMLGLAHEHQNPNEPIEWDIDAIFADLSQAPNFWTMEDIQHNIIRRYNINDVDATPTDKDSIMMYQIPSRWTKNGFSAGFNDELSETDKLFLAGIYTNPTSFKIVRAFAKLIFSTESEILKLKESTLIRMGSYFGLKTNIKLLKKDNARIISRHLNLSYD